jgi:hypothetical protein
MIGTNYEAPHCVIFSVLLTSSLLGPNILLAPCSPASSVCVFPFTARDPSVTLLLLLFSQVDGRIICAVASNWSSLFVLHKTTLKLVPQMSRAIWDPV